ncbi:hypothetical protein [Pseudooceanicola marinus]|uniref:hypothetical protein n=1 Tax=Pseudooceanicola marinus TaxID=396013 RepID=UPI001CD69719|nr:hypothetical protein [Pseudooceanicola marinus]MCA1336872.1 hypothetical protein [Pseudooceanicola marinus]
MKDKTMNMPAPTPERMTAADRREAWFGDERTGLVEYLRGYDLELGDHAAAVFRAVEQLFGRDAVASHLLKVVPNAPHDAETWGDVLFAPSAPRDGGWKAVELLDGAGLYGLFGVTPEDIPFAARRAWVAKLPLQLADLKDYLHLKADGEMSRVVNLALSRHALDTGFSYDDTGEETLGVVDIGSLAIFGGVTEGRIRNILSSGDGGLEKVGQRVTAVSAATWLKGRKEFFASIWQLPDEVAPEAPSPDFAEEVVFVPVAADGSHFHPGLARGGKFMIGAKGEEVQYPSFDEALAALQKMATPRWRRPNEVGNWGSVSGRDWKRIERRQLMSM